MPSTAGLPARLPVVRCFHRRASIQGWRSFFRIAARRAFAGATRTTARSISTCVSESRRVCRVFFCSSESIFSATSAGIGRTWGSPAFRIGGREPPRTASSWERTCSISLSQDFTSPRSSFAARWSPSTTDSACCSWSRASRYSCPTAPIAFLGSRSQSFAAAAASTSGTTSRRSSSSLATLAS